MIGDRHVFIATRLGRLRHLSQAALAVRGLGMDVEVAPDVLERDEVRQFAGNRRLDFAPVFAKLGLDVRQLDGGEDLFLSLPSDPFAFAKDAILVDLEPARPTNLANGDVVRLGAGEIVERRAITLLRYHAQIDLDA